jgi:hypothetical protein
MIYSLLWVYKVQFNQQGEPVERQDLMLSSVERDISTNHTKQLECWFCHGLWTWEIKNEELTSLNFSLNLGSEEMSIEEYAQLAWEEIVDVEYNMVELVGLAWNREIHLGLNLNEEPMKGNDVDDQPTPIVKLPQAHDIA